MIAGREPELQRIFAVLEEARLSRAGALVVRGEVGIGKPGRAAAMIGTAAEASLYLGDYEETLATARLGQRLAADGGGMGGFLIAALTGCGLVGTGSLDEGRRELRRAIAIGTGDPGLRTDLRVLGWLVPVYGFLDEFKSALAAATQR